MTPVAYRHLGRDELDAQLSPSRVAKDFAGVLQRHVVETAGLGHVPGLRRIEGVSYGNHLRQKLDLTAPAEGSNLPCLVFMHGGFWQEGDRSGSGFAAAAFAARGWAHAGVGYRLTPEVRLRDIVDDTAAAILHLQDHAEDLGIDGARIVLAGHSAGAHLAAAILCGCGGPRAADAVAGAVLISGVYDLDPVAASYVNDRARIDRTEVDSLSPLFLHPCRDVPVHIMVGGDEPDAFQVQSRALHAAWSEKRTALPFETCRGRDHFDVLDELADPGSPCFAAVLAMGG